MDFLARHAVRDPGRAFVCLIHGDEGECHESLVERLAHNAELFALKNHGDNRRLVKIAKIPWQYEGTVAVRIDRLVARLLERFSTTSALRVDDTSPVALGALIASSGADFVFVAHDLRAARLDNQMSNMIEAYRGYLAGIPPDPSGQQIVVCLNIIYPCTPVSKSNWLTLRPRLLARKLLKARIQRDLAGIAGASSATKHGEMCACLLLNELMSITRDDVLEWFSLHNILETEEQRLTAAGRIFGSAGMMASRKSMAEIETHLRNVQHTFLLERGFI